MATATNPVTGDLIKTKGSNNAYRDGWDRIFGKKKEEEKPVFHLKQHGDVTEEELERCMKEGKL